VSDELRHLRPGRVLIVKPSALGDIVHTLPLLRLLRLRWPAAHISWLVAPGFASILDGHPLLDRVIHFDRKGLATLDGGARVVGDWLAFGQQLAEERFDLVIDVQGLFRSAMLTLATTAPVRVGFGYAREMAWLGYTHRIASRSAERHAVERYLDLAEAFGCPRDAVFEFHVTDQDRAAVDELLAGVGRFCVLLPGTNWDTKKWPIDSYAALSRRIEAEWGLRCVVAGAKDVIELAARIPSALNLATKTTLPQLVELLRRASLVVANDSGPMHIASALGVPLATIFGPTNAVRTGPFGRAGTVVGLDIVCRPCYSRTCSHHSCMKWLDVDAVFEHCRRQLGGAT
jgi:heptosyltransferase I